MGLRLRPAVIPANATLVWSMHGHRNRFFCWKRTQMRSYKQIDVCKLLTFSSLCCHEWWTFYSFQSFWPQTAAESSNCCDWHCWRTNCTSMCSLASAIHRESPVTIPECSIFQLALARDSRHNWDRSAWTNDAWICAMAASVWTMAFDAISMVCLFSLWTTAALATATLPVLPNSCAFYWNCWHERGGVDHG